MENIHFIVEISEKTAEKTEEKKKKSKTAEEKSDDIRNKKLKARKEQSDKIGSKVNQSGQALKNPVGFASGNILGGITKFIPHIALIGIAASVFQIIKTELFRDGGIFDRRLKIYFERQTNIFENRQRTRELSIGKRVIRATSAPGLRGAAGSVGGNLLDLQQGRGVTVDRGFDTKGI